MEAAGVAAPAPDEPACGGCHRTLESASGGVVVAFGNALWHVECFRCAKCRTTVSADTNLLLLADGSPVCQSCSYSCHVCHNPILDEAIMTGDDSYHAACFKCRSCARRIEELVFAKTSQGIYCMSCHNDRVARSRRHAEQKKRSRTRSRKDDSHVPSSAAQSPTPSQPSRRHPTEPNQVSSPATISAAPSPALLSANNSQHDLGKRRKSYDDGVRPLSSFFAMGPGVSTTRSPSTSATFAAQQQAAITNSNGGLNIPTTTPTSRADKRRSINPGLVMPPSPVRPRGNSVGAPPDERAQLSPYSIEGSRAASPSRDIFEPPTRNGSVDTRTASTDVQIPGMPLEDTMSILGPNEGEITMMFEEPTFTLDASSLDEPALAMMMMHIEDDDPTVDVRRPHANGHREGRSSSPGGLRATSPGISRSTSPSPADGRSASPANLGRSTSPLGRSASPNGRSISPGLGGGRSASPIGRSTSPRIGRSTSPSPASTFDQTLNANGAGSTTRSASPLVTKSASQGAAIAARTASPAPATRNASPAPSGRVMLKSASQGTNGVKAPAAKGTPTRAKSGGRESLPPPAVPPKDKAQETGVYHQYTTSFSALGAFGSTASGTATPSGASTVSGTSNVSATSNSTSRPTHPRSSSSSSSSPIIDHGTTTATATYGAMQLPPMRFSLSDTDFADLLKGVGVDSNGKLRLSLIGRGSLDIEKEKEREKEKQDDGIQGPTVKLVSEQEPGTAKEPMTVKLVQEDRRRPSVDADKQKSSAESGKKPSSDSDRRRPSGEYRSSVDRTPTPASEPFPRISSETRPSVSSERPSVTVPDSATASVLEDDDEFEQTTTLTTPIIRTTLAPPTGPFRERADSISQGETIIKRLKEMAENAQERGSTSVKVSLEFLDAITKAVVGSQDKYSDLKGRYDGIKRTSQQFIDGLSVAQSEYDKELAARRDAEAEVTRLRVQLSGQAARLTAMSAESRIREVSEQQTADANLALRTLLRDVAKLKTERDMIVAEMDELGKKSGVFLEPLEARLEGLRKQYRKDLEGLKLQREGLVKEITELKEHRDIFLEETTALNARNEELAELNAQIQRQVEQQMGATRPQISRMDSSTTQLSLGSSLKEFGAKTRPSLGMIGAPNTSVSSMGTVTSMMSSVTATSTPSVAEEKEREKEDVKVVRIEPAATKGGFKWLKPKAPSKDPNVSVASSVSSRGQPERSKGSKEHNFVPQSVLRPVRCDQCGDKMWGMQMRCSNCPMACHNRCVFAVRPSCQGVSGHDEEPVVDISPLPPSMFGRDLVEQVRADAKNDPGRMVPVIVDKCIRAVEALAMDYEGIYRKTGGTSLSKAITQLFERGNYNAFDLEDTDSFNDISSITSVMKTYFRQLPNPLLTFALHEKFVEASSIRDANAKREALVNLIQQLPPEHYHTLRYLMLHLSRIKDCSEENLMTARNIGVVFGPTLMRSADPAREFGDMAGKALTVEWLVENAPSVFSDPSPI